ncbi:enoyl-CoA hydratase/isomerase family protein [Actinocorallia sp. A-T 12471]|uniref:enoyl-CoA hydratase/isomerase family protein n=1 Tax=Actinocorallia sp. A-T 12471 TaxID=3089813 RepID=UPI0029D1B0D3|nr:enoyl-CoA hydratase/isomerase family protein [Actinocorallia sp. A-T 12471]MDX6741050.1 enoyl-CoA hydratase/isomerase family protein [Actinocorallia sp. A-T 12471]
MVELELDRGVAVITINRPQARNAIAPATMDELDKALDAAEGARALVITGAGDRAFVSGGDLKELAAVRTDEQARAMALRMRGVCDRLAAFPAPVVAALNGHALGGGAEVAVAADIRIAADDVRIGFTQATLAIMPAWGGAERLAALVGRGRAILLAGTGLLLGAAEAERLGLVDQVVPRAEFPEAWRTLAHALADGPGLETKRITAPGVTADEAAGEFAKLWCADAHWEAVERAMNRGK